MHRFYSLDFQNELFHKNFLYIISTNEQEYFFCNDLIDFTSQAYHLNKAPINCGTFHIIFSIFVTVGFMPCD